MTKNKYSYRALFLALPVMALTGCFEGGPAEQLFLDSAAKQLLVNAQSVCLRLPPAGAVVSISGGLPRGWVAWTDAPTPAVGKNASNREDLPRLEALVSAGLVEKSPYEVYVAGQLYPAHRYWMTAEGLKYVERKSFGDCIQIGLWTPAKLVPAPNEQNKDLIRKKTEGETVTYEALVDLTPSDLPAWASTPALTDEFGEELSILTKGKTLNVELRKVNKDWVTQPTSGASKSPMAEIPGALHATALSKLTAGNQAFGSMAGLALPRNASETPPLYARAHPGELYFMDQPNVPEFLRSRQAQREAAVASHESSLAVMTTAQRSLAQKVIAQERAGLVSNPGEDAQLADRYLNQRKELKELLDTLVEAGAYTMRPVVKGEVPETTEVGRLYVPAAGTAVTSNLLVLGTPKYSGPLKQSVAFNGSALTVKVNFELVDKPTWFAALALKVPGLVGRAAGTQTFIVRPAATPDFPYSIGNN